MHVERVYGKFGCTVLTWRSKLIYLTYVPLLCSYEVYASVNRKDRGGNG